MRKNFILALIGIGIGGIGFGLVTPVTIILLEQNHAPSIIIGSSAMVGYISIVIFSRYTGRLIDAFGVKTILAAGLFIWMLSAFGHMFWYIYPLLYFIKIIMGVGGTFIFVSTEVIINAYSDETNRGKNIGLYVGILSVGIAVGTLLIWTIKLGNWVPFVIGSSIVLFVFALQMILMIDVNLNADSKKIEKMPLSKMPVLSLFSAFIYGVFESSIMVALPLYGLRNNFSEIEVSYFLTSFVLGGIILLYFIGHLADKVMKYKLLLLISFLLCLLFILPITSMNFLFLVIIFFFIGGIVPSFYTVGLNYTVEEVEKKFMAQANGYFTMLYGAGTIAGPILGTTLIVLNKENGYWIFAASLCFCFFFLFKYYKKKISY